MRPRGLFTDESDHLRLGVLTCRAYKAGFGAASARVPKSPLLVGHNRNWLRDSIANGVGSETESEAEKHVIATDD
jgi:hypothetical protein